MAPHSLLPHLLPFFVTLFARVFASDTSINSSLMYPLNCTRHIKTCKSTLYHINIGLPEEQIASFYSVNTSQIKPIAHANKQDYLITAPCSCKDINGTTGYFYDTSYRVQQGDTFDNVSAQIYSGQAWKVEGQESSFIAGDVVSMHLLCGCVENNSQSVVTYTVQQNDTLSDIATLLSAKISEIERMNRRLIRNPNLIDVGWVLFVPMEKN
ncbi:hypothetical protein L1049_020928 [Liquidambar formosana]|uniref:LysM domain-containing protein n=1 Tax=Liquidambar formosana TaxID=63359 RepID=A0AAP0X6J1_LIQFO